VERITCLYLPTVCQGLVLLTGLRYLATAVAASQTALSVCVSTVLLARHMHPSESSLPAGWCPLCHWLPCVALWVMSQSKEWICFPFCYTHMHALSHTYTDTKQEHHTHTSSSLPHMLPNVPTLQFLLFALCSPGGLYTSLPVSLSVLREALCVPCALSVSLWL
jgi:hypothetical protein